MSRQDRNQKWIWLGTGTLFGFILAYYCPHEPAYAETAVSGEKFAMCTVTTGPGQSDAVFVLDMVTGRLIGGIYNSQANGFTQTYARNLAADFKVVENAQYQMVTGFASTTGGGGNGGAPATGVIYVAELNSGLVGAYGLLYSPQSVRAVPTRELAVLGTFPWRAGP